MDEQPRPGLDKPESPKEIDPVVHAMPEQFLNPSAHKVRHAPGKHRSGMLIALIVLGVVALLVVGATYFMLRYNNAPAPTTANENENANRQNQNLSLIRNSNQNLNQNSSGNGNANANLNVNGSSNANANLNLNANRNANANGNVNAPVNQNTNVSPTVPNASDTDEDGLTDQEESLYQTNETLKDTDGDGYIDGLEIMNGYSPLFEAGTHLIDAGGAKIYANVTHQFSVSSPLEWTVDERTPNEIMFITSTVEFMEVLIDQKASSMTIEDWYDDQVNVDDALEGTTTTVNGLPAVVSPNGLTTYIGDGTTVFVITYNYGTRETINFRTSYNFLVDSFVREVLVAPTNANNNANQNKNTNSGATNRNSNLNANRNANINSNTNRNANANRNAKPSSNANANKNSNTGGNKNLNQSSV